jgi:hypothetical protein
MTRNRPSRLPVAEENARIEAAIARLYADGKLLTDAEWAEDNRARISVPSSLTGFYHAEPGGQRRSSAPSPTASAVAQYHGAGARKSWARRFDD